MDVQLIPAVCECCRGRDAVLARYKGIVVGNPVCAACHEMSYLLLSQFQAHLDIERLKRIVGHALP